jgi:flavodoxin I
MRAIVIYGSTTGLTEKLSQSVATSLLIPGWYVCHKNVKDTHAAELNGYDLIVMGCSTWGHGELQEDFIPFEGELRGVSLKGKKASVFGAGSKSYPHFCAAVDILEQSLKDCGAQIVSTPLKIDEGYEAPFQKIAVWAKDISETMSRSSLRTDDPGKGQESLAPDLGLGV